MRKNVKIIQINGFKGVILALAIIACLSAGFIAFPGFLVMQIWNYISVKLAMIPSIGIIQGALLWGIAVVSYMIIRNKHFMVSFKTPTELSEDELDEVMSRIKMDTTPEMMSSVIAASKKPVIKDINPKDASAEDVTNKNLDN